MLARKSSVHYEEFPLSNQGDANSEQENESESVDNFFYFNWIALFLLHFVARHSKIFLNSYILKYTE